MSGALYIVATPIGNLKDITFRAVEILKSVDIILAEDKRVTGKLLAEYDIIPKKFISYHQHSKDNKKFEILNYLIKGENMAYVSDAGTPGVSDPGNELVSFVVESNSSVDVVPIPGPTAITTALSVSGINVNKFVFLGFLPKKKRKKLFNWLKEGDPSAGSGQGIPFAFYESPNRIINSLELIREEFGGDVEVFIARELTKLHESLYRGKLSEIVKQFQKMGKIKGELVVVIRQ